MKFECSHCGHLGEAEEVRPSGGGVEVVCAECGEASGLEVGSGDSDETEASEAGDESDASDLSEAPDSRQSADLLSGEERTTEIAGFEVPAEPDVDPSSFGSADMTLSNDRAMENLRPQSGAGIRCPKCAKLLRADAQNCVQCGLDIDEARRYDDGEAPWEQPRPGMEEQHEQATLLWEAFEEDQTDEKLRRFVDFVDEERLYEMGIRKLRFYLVDHPDHDVALEGLRECAVGVQGQIHSARAQAEAKADELNSNIKVFKRRLIVGAIVVITISTVVLLAIVW